MKFFETKIKNGYNMCNSSSAGLYADAVKGEMNMSVNNLNQQQIQTREQYKKTKVDALEQVRGENSAVKEKEKAKAVPRQNERIRIRLLPIWLRLLLLAVFTVVSLVAGAAVGYGVIGDGKPSEVLKESTWTHIRDLVQKK